MRGDRVQPRRLLLASTTPERYAAFVPRQDHRLPGTSPSLFRAAITGGFTPIQGCRQHTHARDRIRWLTIQARLAAPVEQVIAEVNRFLRGWAGYFRFGNSARLFDAIRRYALLRIALCVAKRHRRGRSWGSRGVPFPVQLGLVSLNGIVVAPTRPGGLRPNTPGEGRW